MSDDDTGSLMSPLSVPDPALCLSKSGKSLSNIYGSTFDGTLGGAEEAVELILMLRGCGAEDMLHRLVELAEIRGGSETEAGDLEDLVATVGPDCSTSGSNRAASGVFNSTTKMSATKRRSRASSVRSSVAKHQPSLGSGGGETPMVPPLPAVLQEKRIDLNATSSQPASPMNQPPSGLMSNNSIVSPPQPVIPSGIVSPVSIVSPSGFSSSAGATGFGISGIRRPGFGKSQSLGNLSPLAESPSRRTRQKSPLTTTHSSSVSRAKRATRLSSTCFPLRSNSVMQSSVPESTLDAAVKQIAATPQAELGAALKHMITTDAESPGSPLLGSPVTSFRSARLSRDKTMSRSLSPLRISTEAELCESSGFIWLPGGQKHVPAVVAENPMQLHARCIPGSEQRRSGVSSRVALQRRKESLTAQLASLRQRNQDLEREVSKIQGLAL